MQRGFLFTSAWLCSVRTFCIVNYDIEVTCAKATEDRHDISGSCGSRLCPGTRLGLRRLQPQIMTTVVDPFSVVFGAFLRPEYRCRAEKEVGAIATWVTNVVVQKVLFDARAGLACRQMVSNSRSSLMTALTWTRALVLVCHHLARSSGRWCSQLSEVTVY